MLFTENKLGSHNKKITLTFRVILWFSIIADQNYINCSEALLLICSEPEEDWGTQGILTYDLTNQETRISGYKWKVTTYIRDINYCLGHRFQNQTLSNIILFLKVDDVLTNMLFQEWHDQRAPDKQWLMLVMYYNSA